MIKSATEPARRPKSSPAPAPGSSPPAHFLLVFLDGVGVGEGDASWNPLARARLPTLLSVLGGRLPVSEQLAEPLGSGVPARLKAIDATLGVAGRPQSGTGQTALLTGRNAPALLGRHFGPWVPTALRELLARENLFQRARALGCSAAFANAYPSGHFEPGGGGARRPGAMPFAARSAGLLVRDATSLRAGDGVVSSITTTGWRRYVDPGAPAVSAESAGRTLASITSSARLTLFAHYDTDLAGHRRDLGAGVAALERVDAFLGGLLAALPPATLLMITSDHGNLEDIRVGHTRNPVPLIALGPGSDRLIGEVEATTDLVPSLLGLLALH